MILKICKYSNLITANFMLFFSGTILLGLAIYFSLITVIDKKLIWDFSNRLSLIVILIVPNIILFV